MAQGLFANQREANLASTVALVEEVLAELGHAPEERRIKHPTALNAWQIPKGSAITRVALIHRADFTHIRVWAVVMTLDEQTDRASLHEHLLEHNTRLCGAGFAALGDHVLLVTERSTLDLDHSEVLELVRRVMNYADEYDDVLVARFGGKLGEAT
jgi:hypothetical protein